MLLVVAAWAVAAVVTFLLGHRRSLRAPSSSPHFAASYLHARGLFRDAAAKHRLPVESHTVAHDPEVGDLTIDSVLVPGRDRSRVVVHVSGTHGAEGFAGSAIQVQFLQTLGQAPAVSVLLVHALNPYGFHHLRRFNENNVDLARNYLTPEQFQAAVARDPDIAGYETCKWLFEVGPWSVVTFWPRVVYALCRYGFSAVKQALVTGQYHDPRGLYYGGTCMQESHLYLRQLVRRLQPQRALIIDVHSGLGVSGEDTIMVDTAAEFAEAQEAFPSALVEGPGGDGASSGYGLALGDIDASDVCGLPPDKALQVTQEFGTVPGIFVARAMIFEAAAYRTARGTGRAKRAAAALRDVFFVNTPQWRASVLQRGATFLNQGIDYVASRQ